MRSYELDSLYERMYTLENTIEEWEREGVFSGDYTYQRMLEELNDIEEEIANYTDED